MNALSTALCHQLIDWSSAQTIQLCPKCLLRFSSVKNFGLYKKYCHQLSDDLPLIGSHLSETADRQTKCFSCLDLLSDSYCDEVADKVVRHLSGDDCEHRFTTFQLIISLPVSITLRNELLGHKIKNFVHNCLQINRTKVEDDLPEKSLDFQNIFAVKDIFKTILIERLERRLKDKPFDCNSLFQISLDFSHKESDTECQKFYELSPKAFFPKICRKSATKSFLNQSSIIRALSDIDEQVLNEWPISAPETNCDLSSIKLTNSPVYIAGRYTKYSRHLSQTPWILDGERLMESSVQDVIQERIQESIKCDQMKFSSSGREDVDVRMLGRGRPFVFELLNPRTTCFEAKQLRQIMSAINDSQKDVFVRDLQIVSKDSIHSDLKEGESQKRKTYQALCCLSRALTEDDINLLSKTRELVIHQKTPIRVLHRRTLSIRQRRIHEMSAVRVSEADVPEEHKSNLNCIFKLNLTTEAGTYIKEFVHSDFGRTEPNLASLLGSCSADIIQLDVMVSKELSRYEFNDYIRRKYISIGRRLSTQVNEFYGN